jgi:hypothetical protein
MSQTPDRAPSVRWDRSAQPEAAGALAVARAFGEHVVIDFGELAVLDGAELSPRLKRRIVLTPVAAKSLFDLLARLTAEGGVSAETASAKS